MTNCHTLKMKANRGKRCFTDVVIAEQLLRIIQSNLVPYHVLDSHKVVYKFLYSPRTDDC